MIARRRSAGYTLQELLVVIAIVGIGVAVAASRLTGKGRQARDAQRFAERITNAAERARMLAVASRSDYRLTISPSDVRVQQQNPTTLVWADTERIITPAEAKVWDTKAAHAAPTAASSTPHIVNFKRDFTVNLDGGPAVNAHVYVAGVLDFKQGHAFRVFVNAAGTVRMFENW